MRILCLSVVVVLLIGGAFPATADNGSGFRSYVDKLVEAIASFVLPLAEKEIRANPPTTSTDPDPGEDESGIMIQPLG